MSKAWLSGTLSPQRVQDVCNDWSSKGWRLTRTFHSRRRTLLFFSRETLYLIFERVDQ